ncbi:universal stress protein [Jidongwangia harbinensis]|uniref:universal stress protein n=1 Tax=Jidongwangia harbinensis TaxID=2878561 RepID=UPI001CDA21F2|nr:universal stress protein [Jidongwangia harbinensis]MCA2218721.1 universal stress protein [Jidongwangia harbinensis]
MTGTIVAGVGGAHGSAALAWAADEAAATDSRLVLLRAYPAARFPDRLPALPLEVADPSLAHTVGVLRNRLGGQRVAVRTSAAAPESVLTECAADLLVIGAGGAGTTVRRILRHARCPVVVVRGLAGGRGAAFAGHVVVAVDGETSGHAALRFAFAWAGQHRVPLAAVHVCPDGPREHVTHPRTRAALDARALHVLRERVEPYSVAFPAVRSRRAILRGPVPEALVQAGIGAGLLVVEGRQHGPMGWPRQDGVPLVVARTADCPVAVVPREHPGGPDRTGPRSSALRYAGPRSGGTEQAEQR